MCLVVIITRHISVGQLGSQGKKEASNAFVLKKKQAILLYCVEQGRKEGPIASLPSLQGPSTKE
jgi:hypothetical protein